MPSLKEYNGKIKTLKNTQKMTKTMKMVSASKFRRAQEAQGKAKSYANHLTDLIGRLASCVEQSNYPLLKSREQVRNVLFLVMTSERGLCGSFNHNINKRTLAWIEENHGRYSKIGMSFCGKRGFMFFRRSLNIQKNYEQVTERPTFAKATIISNDLSQLFLSGQYDEVYLVHNVYYSPISQRPQITKVLPLDANFLKEKTTNSLPDYLFEPQPHEVLDNLIPKYLNFKIYYALLENAAGEHGARMTAMDNASRNAGDLVDKYTLLRNRARQSSITKELIEIISGVEALK